MEKDNQKPILKFEPGSRQPFILYLISVTIISAIIVIVCLFTSGMSFSPESNDSLGDVNLDGVVDSEDALVLSKHLTGDYELNEKQLKAADVDNNGEINSKDSMLIIQHIGTNPPQQQTTTKPADKEEIITTEPTSPDASQPTQEPETQPTESTSSVTEPEIKVDFKNSGKGYNTAFFTGENGVYYVARITNSWTSSDGKYMYQVDFTVKNNSQSTVYNTSADITFNDSVSVEKNWDCTAVNNSGVITLKTKNEGRILKGGTFTCGIVISAGCPITIESVAK